MLVVSCKTGQSFVHELQVSLEAQTHLFRSMIQYAAAPFLLRLISLGLIHLPRVQTGRSTFLVLVGILAELDFP